MLEIENLSIEKVVVKPLEIENLGLDELEKAVLEDVNKLNSFVITDETIKEGKGFKADINKKQKKISDYRIALKKKIAEVVGVNDINDKLNELQNMYNKPKTEIEKKITEFEERERELKQIEINKILAEELQNSEVDESEIVQNGWLNKTASLKSIREDIQAQREMQELKRTTINNFIESKNTILKHNKLAYTDFSDKLGLNIKEINNVLNARFNILKTQDERIEESRKITEEKITDDKEKLKQESDINTEKLKISERPVAKTETVQEELSFTFKIYGDLKIKNDVELYLIKKGYKYE